MMTAEVVPFYRQKRAPAPPRRRRQAGALCKDIASFCIEIETCLDCLLLLVARECRSVLVEIISVTGTFAKKAPK